MHLEQDIGNILSGSKLFGQGGSMAGGYMANPGQKTSTPNQLPQSIGATPQNSAYSMATAGAQGGQGSQSQSLGAILQQLMSQQNTSQGQPSPFQSPQPAQGSSSPNSSWLQGLGAVIGTLMAS